MKKTTRRAQPWVVTIQLGLVLCFTIWNVIRSASSLLRWSTLAAYNVQPAYIFTTGILWTIAGLTMIWLIWQAKHLAILTGKLLILGFLFYDWIDRLLIQTVPTQGIIFQVGIELILVLLFLIPFSLKEGAAYYIKEIQ